MARSQKDGTIFILDVSTDKDFYETAKTCISKSIEKCIFTCPKDEVGLFITGGDTRNRLNDQYPDSYLNILEAVEMTGPTWKHLRYIDSVITAGEEKVDWLDSIILALDYIRTLLESRKFSDLEIVLFTPECGVVGGLDQLENVEQSFAELGVVLKVVVKGTVIPELQALIDATSGSLMTIQKYEDDVRYFMPKSVKGTAWNKGLTLGSQLEIQCAAYVKICNPKMVPSFKIKSATSAEPVNREKKYYKNFKEYEIDIDNMMNGFMYGGSPIPNFTFMRINYAEGCSHFALHGFTNQKNVHSEFLSGEGCHVVIPQTKYPVSVRKFNALVRTLISTKSAMIVRKMYNRASTPKLNVLIPGYIEEENPNSQPIFTMIEILYKEDLIELKLPKLKEVPAEQLEAVDKLIDSMELTSLDDYLRDPGQQLIMRRISKRAMKSKEPLTVIDGDIQKLLDVSENIRKSSEEPAKVIKELFPLESVKKQTKLQQMLEKLKVTADDAEDGAETSTDADADPTEVTGVTTVNPAEEYDALIRRGESFKLVSDQMEQAVHRLVFESFKVFKNKVAIALTMYREHSKVFGSFRYNDFVASFKGELMRNGREDFFTEVIVEHELGLITADESDNSTRTREEAVQFYVLSKPREATPPREVMNVDDDLDDLLE